LLFISQISLCISADTPRLGETLVAFAKSPLTVGVCWATILALIPLVICGVMIIVPIVVVPIEEVVAPIPAISLVPVINAVGGQSGTVAIGSPTNETCASSNSQLFLAVALSQARVQGASVLELGPRPRALLVAFHPLQNWLEGGEGGSSGRGWSDPSRSTRRRQKPPLPSARTEASTAR